MRPKVIVFFLFLVCTCVLAFIIVTRGFPSIGSIIEPSAQPEKIDTINYPQPSYQDQDSKKGTVLLQFAPIGSASSSLYAIDMQSSRLHLANFSLSYVNQSYDGRWIVGMNTLTPVREKSRGFYIFDVATNMSNLFATTSDQYALKPVISPDGSRVAYMSLHGVSTIKKGVQPKNSSIYVISKGGSPQFVAHGAFPQWSPDGTSLLYLGDDGIHLINLQQGKDDTVWTGPSGSQTLYSGLTISNDGTLLVLSRGAGGEGMSVMHITQWAPFAVTPFQEIIGHDYDPVIAPDGSGVAYAQYDLASSMDPAATHLRLMAHAFKTGVTRYIADLSHIADSDTVLTMWTFSQ